MLKTVEAIERRRSIRKYKPDHVSDDILKSLLESARMAPSGCNAQPWRFKVVRDKETKRKLAQAAFDQLVWALLKFEIHMEGGNLS